MFQSGELRVHAGSAARLRAAAGAMNEGLLSAGEAKSFFTVSSIL